jgi:hypothetical protein
MENYENLAVQQILKTDVEKYFPTFFSNRRRKIQVN